ncbi:carboxypeptidase-like regulatory domain-containing protein [Christiangramia sabulilitoris]|uniref:TonB-dependent receptor n=1 Tax=Christiangramia sabulilitoris TaxID=2583991 RepID=A0A550I8F4_9FLAO|nr:carboxypeptidase-like regulatory domain-containing protein [Christiangramia sabulilitoris]TRO67250.1 TonB-dependent receptor [Christiangramia sabulilitoris]
MKISIFWGFIFLLFSFKMNSQQSVIKGRLVDAITNVPLPLVKIAIEGLVIETLTDPDGEFSIGLDSMDRTEVVVVFSKTGYTTKRFPLNIGIGEKTLETISLNPDAFYERSQQSTISLSDADIISEEAEFDNISGLLQSTRDVFLNAAAFDFSQTFFRVRGFGSEYGKLMINGIEMNKLFDGRPQWSNWGGLNDVQRNQIFSNGISANEYGFGGLGGTTNIIMRASKYQKANRISLAGSNRSYNARLMATIASGEQGSGWFYAISIGRRYAEEAYIEGTAYDSNSFFAAVEKRINENHSLNLTGIFTPVTRGRSAPLTQEVLDLKGSKYNPHWGLQNGKIRNSRIRKIKEPILMLNHFWQITRKVQLNTNLAYQFGEISNSRIDYGGTTAGNLDGQPFYFGAGANPDPTYYQNLPGYYLRFENNQNFEAAYRAQSDFLEDGQLDWNRLYLANTTNTEIGNNSAYVLAEDVNKDDLINVNAILNWEWSDRLKLTGSLRYTDLKNRNFARINDLLGGNSFLDIDVYAEQVGDTPLILAKQSDLSNLNRLVKEADIYKYDYDIRANLSEVFIQGQYAWKRLELTLSGKFGNVMYQRTGNFQNGLYASNSLGESDELNFQNFGLKTGFLYKFSGRQNVEFNLGYFLKPPAFRNTFVNPRQNNAVVRNVREEKIRSTDLSYRYRTSKFNVRLTGYFTTIDEGTEVSNYFANGLGGLGSENTAAFVQEVLTGIDRQHFGLEIGSEYQITSTLKAKVAASLGQFTYASNPSLYLNSASFSESKDYGRAYLKNYFLAGGPQRAALAGFEYRDPEYWWFGTTVNYFSHAFLDVNPLTRTSNFQTDFDGLPLLDYDPAIARELLQQEQFDDYFLVNMVGGKSWRLRDKYLGFFVSINNLLDREYKSGGFEQARNANYRTLKQDRDREIMVFGNKYWLGYGTSFFANVSLRF